MNSFKKALKDYPMSAKEKEKINSKLAEWKKKNSNIPDNIYSEHFLPSENMSEILKVILNNYSGDIQELKKAYKDECDIRHIRKGGEIKNASPKKIGRAVEKKKFITEIFAANKSYFMDEDDAKDFVENLIENKLAGIMSELKMDISLYSAWVTWNKDKESGEPFFFLKNDDPQEILAHLGMEKHDDEEEKQDDEDIVLLLLTFEKQDNLTLYRPTIADAGNSNLFCPPPEEFEDYGLTMPCKDSKNKIGYKPERKPEAVCKPLTIDCLLKVKELE
ncbi:MAG: hypothetical protein JRJ49_02605 [Deltaproteobacteria bacterium]|nr:hypothetical protein [Deltaproteobacteria bacterium]